MGQNKATVMASLPTRDKAVLLAIKSAFAFSWGFLDVIAYLLTRRFATMMSGNTLLLAIQTADWKVEEMMVTATFIGLYVFGGAVHDALLIQCKDDGRVVKYFVMPVVIVMGVLADVIEYLLGSCSSGTSGGAKCSGKYLYFLAPIALVTGIVTPTHHDRIVTNMVTGHMKVLPLAILKRFLKGEPHPACLEKGFTSAAITTSFFLGCLSGTFSSDPILVSYSKGYFTPVFTAFSCVIAMLCFWHYALCEYFCFNYEVEEELADILQETLVQSERLSPEHRRTTTQGTTTNERPSHCRINTHDLLRIALDAIEKEEEEKARPPTSSCVPPLDPERRTHCCD